MSALVEIGELERGRALCEKLLSYASPLGLYAEEIDPRSGRHFGNFPQAFTHLALINAVMHVIRADQGFEYGRVRLRARAGPPARGPLSGVGKLAFLFPGQGSQKVGMDADLRETDPGRLDALLEAADEISGLSGRALRGGGPEGGPHPHRSRPAGAVRRVAGARRAWRASAG